MFINAQIDFRKSKDGKYYINNASISFTDTAEENEFSDFYKRIMRIETDQREGYIVAEKETFPNVYKAFFSDEEENAEGATAPVEMTEAEKKKAVIDGLKHLIDFFKEFDFEPNFRFVNTLSLNLKQGEARAKEYINNYFELIDSPYCNEISAKVKSKEFSELLNNIKTIAPTKIVNHRFNLYYGSQGTGKTTIAVKESGSNPIVCNSSMLPSDLMEDFVFVDGKATYTPSAFWRAMVEGRTIVMDEINLLPYDTLRFLQGLLDNKSAITYKGNEIEINENFRIIGTMNLTVNGMTYGLPEPLVDRCATTKKFSLSAADLFSAIV